MPVHHGFFLLFQFFENFISTHAFGKQLLQNGLCLCLFCFFCSFGVCLCLFCEVRRLGGGAVGRQDVGLKGDVQRLELGAGPLDHRPITIRTHDDCHFTNHLYPTSLSQNPTTQKTKKAVMHLHHGLLFRLRQHRLAAGYTKALMHPRAETALGTQQLIPHSAPPPQTSLSTLFFPAEKRVCLPFRPPSRYSIRQKNAFAKSVRTNFPLCSLLSKNFQKFCAVSTLFFFLSTTYQKIFL